MRTRFGSNGRDTTQALINSIVNRSNAPSIDDIESREPYMGFNAIMALNGWYWEPYGSVIHVVVETRNLIRVECRGKTSYKSLPHFRAWITKMGYEKEKEDDNANG
jgi:hypothetical protein